MAVNDYYVELPIKNILKEGRTTKPGLCDKRYVVYFDPLRPGEGVHINADYKIQGNVIKINRKYDRRLCKTIKEFELYQKTKSDYIEGQAYNAYMDGAR